MTRRFKFRHTALLFAAALAGGVPALAAESAAKQAVDAAKVQGTVGEQADGFLGVVSGGDTALRAAVAEINAGRAAVYRETAAKTGVTAEAAGQAIAAQLLARLPAGQYFKPAGGGWTKK